MSSNKPSPASAGTIPAGDFHLSYVVEGVGHPVIVIGSALFYSRTFSQNLRNHLQLVFMDHRGFSSHPYPVETSEYELDKLVDDIERLRQNLGFGKVAVIGHSGHGYMALEYGKKYSEYTSHVIMIGTPPNLSDAMIKLADENYQLLADTDRHAAEQENMHRLSEEQLATLSPNEAFIQGYVREAARYWYNPRFDSTHLWEGITVNTDMFDYVWGKLFDEIDVTYGLEQFDRPIFLTLGRYDFSTPPPSIWDDIKPKFKNLTIRIFEKSAHYPHLEEPELFDRELLAWMNQHAG
jgi:proline iminopeptidase